MWGSIHFRSNPHAQPRSTRDPLISTSNICVQQGQSHSRARVACVHRHSPLKLCPLERTTTSSINRGKFSASGMCLFYLVLTLLESL